jgi:hypothetical protein
MPRRSRIAAIGSAVLWLLIPARSPGDDLAEVEGKGESTVIGGNAVSARRRALASASADAVAHAVVLRVGAEVSAREAEKLRAVQARAGQVLRRYRVLEERQEGNRFLVRIAAVIDEQRLQKELARLGLARAGGVTAAPKLTLQVAGDPVLAKALRVALGAALAEEGFPVEEGRCTTGAGCVEGTVTLSARDEVRGAALPLAQVRLSLALRLGGTPAPSAKGEAWGFGANAAAHALERALAPLLPPLRAELQRRHPRPTRALRVAGVSTLTQLLALERAPVLGPATLEEAAAGEARLALSSPADGRALASALEKLALPGFSLTISKIEGGTLWLTLRPSAAQPAP